MPKRFLSLGAGVQSSTVALLIAHGELPMVDAAIFADTQWEPQGVYDWLGWLEAQLPFPVYRVTAGDIRQNLLTKQNTTGGRYASVPWHLLMPDGTASMQRRQCTSEYKLGPLVKEKRRLLGAVPRQRLPLGSCETLIGISIDEASRAKDSHERWNVNTFPLLDLRMSRNDCLKWMAAKGYDRPPKSSCLGCPYHSNTQWREIKDTQPEAWSDLVQLDRAIRAPVRGLSGQQFMHRSHKPLDEVDLTTAEERGQINLFENECEGICGV